jgi:hypothetical protein
MSNWIIDVDTRTVQHETGLMLMFDIDLESDHFAGSLQHYPKELTPLQISRLIREGLEEFRKAHYAASASRSDFY